MKNFLTFKIAAILIFSTQFVIAQQYTSNGCYMPVNTSNNGNQHPIKVLLVFVQINYNGNSQTRPTGFDVQNVAQAWPVNTIPQDIVNWFNPNQSGEVVKYFNEASFGKFSIEADYITQLITINETDITDLYNGYPVIQNPAYQNNFKNHIYSAFNNLQAFTTGQNLTPADFDNWNDNHTVGAQKQAISNNNFDFIAFFIRNHPANSDVGFASENQSNNTINYTHNGVNYGLDNFVMQTGSSYRTFIHELGHLLIGGNNFHSSGGQHNQGGTNYFGPRQSGWGIMGFGSLLTINAFERDRFNWVHSSRTPPANPQDHAINCFDLNNNDVSSDLDPTVNNNSKIFLLRDFISFGDAIRIKLPYINSSNEFQQFLWLENHQTNQRNNSTTDKLIFDNNFIGCRPLATPGLYAYIQVEKNIKAGSVAFSGYGDNLRALPANGFFDYEIPGTTYLNCVAYNGDGTAPYYKKTDKNPLTGASDLEYIITDKNNDLRIGLGEEILTFIEERNGQTYDDLPFHGLTTHAFTYNGNNKIAMGTNPSANNLLTEVSYEESLEYGQFGIKNNRTVYLNGVSAEIIGEQPNATNNSMMDLVINIRFDDVAVAENVNWSADNIVLPPINSQGGNSLELAANKCITVYHGTTPTKVGRINEDSTTLYNGTRYFSQPTKFYVEPTAKMLLKKGSSLVIKDDSRFIMNSQSELNLAPNAMVLLQDHATMILRPEALINFSAGSYIEIKDNARLIIEAGNGVELTGIPEIRVNGNGKLIIENDALLTLANSGLINIEQGGTLEYNNTISGKGLQLGATNGTETELRLAGLLKVAPNTNFTFFGNGFLHLKNGHQIEINYTKKLMLTGNNINDKILEISENVEGNLLDFNVELENGSVKYNLGSVLKHSFKNFTADGIKFLSASNNTALKFVQSTTVNILNCDFSDFYEAINSKQSNQLYCVNSTFDNCSLPLNLNTDNFIFLNNSTFYNSTIGGIAIKGINQNILSINNCAFNKFGVGIEIFDSKSLYLNNTEVTDGNFGIIGRDVAVFMRNNSKIKNMQNNGIYLAGTRYDTQYNAMLTMGDLGCASIYNIKESAIYTEDVVLNIDAEEHFLNNLNNGNLIPNRIYCNESYNVESCFKLQSHSPAFVLGKGNFYKMDDDCTTPDIPTNNDFNCTKKFCYHTIPFNFSNYSNCMPEEENCINCNLEEPSPHDPSFPLIRQEFALRYNNFIQEDNNQTRAAFVNLASIGLFKFYEDVWGVSIEGDTVDVSESDAQMIKIAKVLYVDTTSQYKNTTIPENNFNGVINLLPKPISEKNLIPVKNFKVYPIPSYENFIVETNLEETIYYKLFTINNLETGGGEFTNKTIISTVNLQSGVYLLKLYTAQFVETHKIIVE